MQSLVQNIYSLNPKYAAMNPGLFGRYLANVGAPMLENELEAQREADRRLQEELRNSGFGNGDQSRKRVLGDANEVNQPPSNPSDLSRRKWP